MSFVRESIRPARLALFSVCLMPLQALAFHPFATDDTGTQGAAGHQFETGFDATRSRLSGTSDMARAVPLTYTYGWTDTLDLFAGVARVLDPVSGWSNVGVGAKWRFHEGATGRFSLALKPEVILPVSRVDETRGLGNAETSYGLTLILSQETGFGEVHLNLGSDRNNVADPTNADRRTVYRASVAPVWKLSEAWKVGMELGLSTQPDRHEDSPAGFVAVGAAYTPDETMDVSFGVTRDFNDGPQTSTSATFGLTLHF